jgi:hypothetical protein
MKTRVSTVTCNSCGDEIYSRATHDYHTCSCGSIAVDGGFEYTRLLWQPRQPKPMVCFRYVNRTKEQLYDDWNMRKDKFGIIKRGPNNGSARSRIGH